MVYFLSQIDSPTTKKLECLVGKKSADLSNVNQIVGIRAIIIDPLEYINVFGAESEEIVGFKDNIKKFKKIGVPVIVYSKASEKDLGILGVGKNYYDKYFSKFDDSLVDVSKTLRNCLEFSVFYQKN